MILKTFTFQSFQAKMCPTLFFYLSFNDLTSRALSVSKGQFRSTCLYLAFSMTGHNLYSWRIYVQSLNNKGFYFETIYGQNQFDATIN